MRDIKVVELRNFNEGMQDGRERRGRRAAEAYEMDGDYAAAARSVRSFDPQMAQTYEGAGDRARVRRETDATKAYETEVAPAVAAGDFGQARTIAQRHGRGLVDVERLTTMAKTARQEELEQARAYNLKQAQALAQIEALPEAQRAPAYAQWKAGLGERGARMPDAYTPLAMRQVLATTMTLEEIYKAEISRRTDIAPDEAQRLGLTGGGFYQRDGNNQVHRVEGPQRAFEVLTPDEAAAEGLPAGQTYQRDVQTNRITRVPQQGTGAGAGGVRANLTPEALEEVKTARANVNTARTLRSEATRWMELNATRGTGGYGELTPGLNAPLFDDAGRQEMRSITARVTPMMRQAGSGTMSDKDVELFQKGTLSIANRGSVNQVIAYAMIEAAKNAEGYVEFLEEFAQNNNGSTLGASAVWNSYLNEYPIFSEGGAGVNRNRPHWRDVLGGGQQQPAPAPRAAPGGGGGPVRVNTQEEYDRLPRGTPYIDSEGNRAVKG
jgi:hypothetical protein